MSEGELWAARELRTLRGDRFSPAAWRRFLSRSFIRARASRRARPALARQATVWSASGLVAGLVASSGARCAGIAAPRPAAWVAWWLSTAAMLDWHLGMVEGVAGERRERLSRADALTLTRVGLVPFVAAQGMRPQRDALPFAVLVAVAGMTDFGDGAIARREGATRLGRALDPVADVLVGVAGVRAARRAGWIGPRIASLALVRQAVPVGVVTAGYFGRGRRPARTRVDETLLTAPALLGGLMVSPVAPRLAGRLVGLGALGALALAVPGRDPETPA